MRLINIHTLEMKDFAEHARPEYAILSHRWTEDELLYEDYPRIEMLHSGGHNGAAKVLAFCAFIRRINEDAPETQRPLAWVWVDTCCINKLSSAELSEAINSMFKWYQNAAYAVAYLSDVLLLEGHDFRPAFKQSRWFERGWCLQELLAPSELLFCDTRWGILGSKVDLSSVIEEVTGIQQPYLRAPRTVFQASVAQRMSWASRRETTRTEDIAYCLMGVFNINMPLLYGEGDKAFFRLQQEIIRQTEDESIFAWTADDRDGTMVQCCVLAAHPMAFAASGNIHRTQSTSQYSMTNRGLRFETRVRHIEHSPRTEDEDHQVELIIIQIACAEGAYRAGSRTLEASPCMLALSRTVSSERWYRVHPASLTLGSLRDDILEGQAMRLGLDEGQVIFLETGMDEYDTEVRPLRVVDLTDNRLWRHLFPNA